jgi:amidohydrolase
MNGLKETILHKSSLLKDEVTSLRRHFHRHPELSYVEFGTASFIEEYLEKHRIPFRRGIAGTGIIGRIDGEKKGGRVVAIRAEMDALPVSETNKTEYASINEGIMHACGHDAHMAMLMGTMRILADLRSQFGGTVLFIFQPGEEKSPGGARLMIGSGELDSPKPDMVLAQHILPELETGRVGYRKGRYMASCDEIYITVTGTGGHAALPGLTTDQIFIASKLVVRLKEEILRKQAEIQIPTVLGIGRITGIGATNVIPVNVDIAGTFRTFDERWRREALILVGQIAEETAREYGVKIKVRIEEGYPVLINDENLTGRAIELSSELLGRERVELYTETRMSSDDFSFYSDLAPSLYFRVGIKKSGTKMKKLHTPEFDIDEDGLETGTANMSWLVYSFLSEDSPAMKKF